MSPNASSTAKPVALEQCCEPYFNPKSHFFAEQMEAVARCAVRLGMSTANDNLATQLSTLAVKYTEISDLTGQGRLKALTVFVDKVSSLASKFEQALTLINSTPPSHLSEKKKAQYTQAIKVVTEFCHDVREACIKPESKVTSTQSNYAAKLCDLAVPSKQAAKSSSR